MDGFVDDMTLWAQLQDNEKDPTKLSKKLKKAAQWWENLLHASRGKLEIDKCFFYILHWVHDEEGKPRLARKEELPESTHTINPKSSETGQQIRTAQSRTKH